MNWENFMNSALVESLGWTLVHSIWQIGLMAGGLFFILRLFKSLSANTRYLLAVFTLCLAFFLPLATFIWLANSPSPNQLLRREFDSESAALINSKARVAATLPPITKDASVFAETTQTPVSGLFESLRQIFRQKMVLALPFIVWLWLAGIAFFTFRLSGGLWQLRKYRTREISAPDAVWQKRFAELCEKLEISPLVVRLWQSTLVKTPIVVGWLKPVILVPASVFLQLAPAELETILIHELMHVRRADNLINFAQSFIEILFFYHPGVWWISGIIRREREFVCDDAVLKLLGNSPIVYASALANLEEIRLLTKQKLPPALSMAASGGKLMQRIQRILDKNAEHRRNSKQSLWLASLAFLLISAVSISVFSIDSPLTVNAESSNKATNKTIAIGFVSLPPLDRTANAPKDSDATARLMIAKLKQYKIPAIGFVLGGAISDGEKLYPVRANIVRLWRDAGFEIGIGGYQHIWFYDTPYDDYVANTEKNARIVKQILAEKNLPLRYFSYPFLNTGKTTADKDRFEAWLKTQGLTSVKYTVDNQEWMYSYAYEMARQDNDVRTMNQIRMEFITYMSKMFDHFEAYSQQQFGRDIAQTMVLTPSRLVADSSDELFGMIEKRGYKFVSMDEALKDAAYQTPENFSGSKSGISWFERWQITQGKKLLDEPNVDADVSKIWNARKPG